MLFKLDKKLFLIEIGFWVLNKCSMLLNKIKELNYKFNNNK